MLLLYSLGRQERGKVIAGCEVPSTRPRVSRHRRAGGGFSKQTENKEYSNRAKQSKKTPKIVAQILLCLIFLICKTVVFPFLYAYPTEKKKKDF